MRSDIVQYLQNNASDPLIQLNVSMDGHTWVYRYRRSQSDWCRQKIKDAVELDECDPYAGLILFRLVKKCESATM